jgi:hypothetical protein
MGGNTSKENLRGGEFSWRGTFGGEFSLRGIFEEGNVRRFRFVVVHTLCKVHIA